MPFTPEQQEQLRISKERVLKLAREREEEERRIKEEENVNLPYWQNERRGTPNEFIRSALFSAIQGKDRVFLDKAVLFSQNGISIQFTGKQLNQEDLTVWQTLVHLARHSPVETECVFTGSSILNMMELSKGSNNYQSLDDSIRRLTACLVEVRDQNKRLRYGGSLIDWFEVREEVEKYKIKLNRRLIILFDDHGWTGIEWNQRLQLRGKSLALASHAYYSSHQTPFPVKLSTLQELTGSRVKQSADFKRRCRSALDELVGVDFLETYQIDKDLVSVERKSLSRTLSCSETIDQSPKLRNVSKTSNIIQ
jgi:TrfA protein